MYIQSTLYSELSIDECYCYLLPISNDGDEQTAGVGSGADVVAAAV